MNYFIKEALQIPSVKRTLNVFAVLSLLVAATPVANLSAFAASNNDNNNGNNNNNSNGCLTKPAANATVVEQNGRAVATFTVPQNCGNSKHRVSLIVYKINDGDWTHKINNQFKFDETTVMVGAGRHTISAKIPSCAWQADLVKGVGANIANGGQQSYGLGAKVGGNAVACAAKPTPTPAPVTPPAPTPTPPAPTPVTVTQTQTQIQNNTTTTPAAETETVADNGKGDVATELVNTGPGDVAATFVGISAIGTLAYQFFVRRRLSFFS